MLYVGIVDVDEHGDEPVLHDRVDGRREAGGDGDDLVAGLEPPVAQPRRGQAAERQQVRRRAGVDEDRVPQPEEARELALELRRRSARSSARSRGRSRPGAAARRRRRPGPRPAPASRRARTRAARTRASWYSATRSEDRARRVVELGRDVRLSRHRAQERPVPGDRALEALVAGRTSASSRACAAPSPDRGTGAGSRSARRCGRRARGRVRPICCEDQRDDLVDGDLQLVGEVERLARELGALAQQLRERACTRRRRPRRRSSRG